MNTRKATQEANRCFELADRLVRAVDRAQHMPVFSAGGFLVVAASQFYGSYWQKPGEVRSEAKRGTALASSPHLILSEALRWVNGLR